MKVPEELDRLEVGSLVGGAQVLSSNPLPEIDGRAYQLRHLASGARILYLQNDDDNKSFCIGFKTPPADDTGTFHILEHSVLCGSRRFPVKEPFVNLLKGSMQTFLNAMTFPDKTVYPVASTNERDLMNLADVYLDAVLHPALYTRKTIFEQEGWHVERTPEGLAYNGVVYNEMKGALSEPDSVLFDALTAALFPQTAYRFESGGTPADIPHLSYDAFLDNHRRHYRLNNSYIVLYGNLDAVRFLEWMDERYLSPDAQLNADAAAPNPLELQPAVRAPRSRVRMETTPENAGAAAGFVIGTAAERTRIFATDILIDALMGSNEAPLKRALLHANLADDVIAYLSDSTLQPYAVVQLKGLHEDGAARFRPTFEQAVARVLEEGIDATLIEASLSHAEFLLRERNFGYADGVAFSISALSGWLYSDDAALDYLRYIDLFAELRAHLHDDFFPSLLREVFLENAHCAEVELVCEEAMDDPTLRALREHGGTLSPEELARIDEAVAALRAAQERPDAPEELATLPHLGLADIGPAPDEAPCIFSDDGPAPCLHHTVNAHGIVYLARLFDAAALSFEELPYASILTAVLGKLSTDAYTASALDTCILGHLGGLSFTMEPYAHADDPSSYGLKLVASASALEANAPWMDELIAEVLQHTHFDDAERLRDILTQRRISAEQWFVSAGHSAAMVRLQSHMHPVGALRDNLSGVGYYLFLKDLLEHFEERAPELIEKLQELCQRLTSAPELVSFTGDDAALARYWKGYAPLRAPEAAKPASHLRVPPREHCCEAFIVPTNVTYTALGFDRNLLGIANDARWPIATHALSFDYLWNEVRVKGGAYGCGFQVLRGGTMRFYSYRDPHITQTIERFCAAGDWLADFSPDTAEWEGYLVSTVADFDTPRKPKEIALQQLNHYLCAISPDERIARRAAVLAATPADVRALGSTVKRICEPKLLCIFGNAALVNEALPELAAAGINLKLLTLMGE